METDAGQAAEPAPSPYGVKIGAEGNLSGLHRVCKVDESFLLHRSLLYQGTVVLCRPRADKHRQAVLLAGGAGSQTVAASDSAIGEETAVRVGVELEKTSSQRNRPARGDVER